MSMRPQGSSPWSQQDAEHLRALREAIGLDRSSAARVACLSLSQWSQLEDGGHSHFYTPEIMAIAGRRALSLLQRRNCGRTSSAD
jgi:hypothetical protein